VRRTRGKGGKSATPCATPCSLCCGLHAIPITQHGYQHCSLQLTKARAAEDQSLDARFWPLLIALTSQPGALLVVPTAY